MYEYAIMYSVLVQVCYEYTCTVYTIEYTSTVISLLCKYQVIPLVSNEY